MKKLTREEKRLRRDLEKAFHLALKQEAKSADWGYIKPTSFKRVGEWFVALHPTVWTDTERAELGALVKPFAIDELMCSILGFDSLEGKPLSLRARGPYCLVRPMFSISVENGSDLPRMMDLSAKFFRDSEARVKGLSIENFITFTADDRPNGQVSDN